MNAKKAPPAKAAAAAAEVDKEATVPLKGHEEANGAGQDGGEGLPQAASLLNGHAHARKSAA